MNPSKNVTGTSSINAALIEQTYALLLGCRHPWRLVYQPGTSDWLSHESRDFVVQLVERDEVETYLRLSRYYANEVTQRFFLLPEWPRPFAHALEIVANAIIFGSLYDESTILATLQGVSAEWPEALQYKREVAGPDDDYRLGLSLVLSCLPEMGRKLFASKQKRVSAIEHYNRFQIPAELTYVDFLRSALLPQIAEFVTKLDSAPHNPEGGRR